MAQRVARDLAMRLRGTTLHGYLSRGHPHGATLQRFAGALPGSAVVAAVVGAVLWAGVVPSAVTARAAEPQRMFWVGDNGTYKRVACDQVAVGTHATIFNCGQPALAPADAAVLIHAFDTRIFPTDIRYFGAPRGVRAVNIVLTPFSGTTFGYFDENDLVSVAGASSHSNHGNFLYVRSLATMPDPNRMADVQEALAHELQHLIDFRIRVLDHGLTPQEVWLNEGLSFYAQLANGFWTPRDQLRVEAAAFDPGWPLTSMNESAQFLRQYGQVSYGRAGMFVTYLARQYGPRFTRDLLQSRQTGMAGIDSVLRREHRGTVADAFAHWAVAQILNAPGLYGYKGILRDHFVTPRSMYPTVTSYPFQTPAAGRDAIVLQPWTQGYMRFSSPAGSSIAIHISAPPNVRLAAIFGTPGVPVGSTVRWLKAGPNRDVSVRLGSYSPNRTTVTIAMSASGGLRAALPGAHLAAVQYRAQSVYARHYKRVSRTASTAGSNADIVL